MVLDRKITNHHNENEQVAFGTGVLVDQLGQCDRHVQERMVWHFYLIDDDFGNRVGEGLGIKAADVAHLDPLPKQQLTNEDRQRLSNFGNNPPRELSGKQMAGCLHVMQADEASAKGSTNGAAYTASRMQSSRSDG
jgi:Catalase-related immune-responsive